MWNSNAVRDCIKETIYFIFKLYFKISRLKFKLNHFQLYFIKLVWNSFIDLYIMLKWYLNHSRLEFNMNHFQLYFSKLVWNSFIGLKIISIINKSLTLIYIDVNYSKNRLIIGIFFSNLCVWYTISSFVNILTFIAIREYFEECLKY